MTEKKDNYSHEWKKSILRRTIPAKVKALLNGEELTLALGRGGYGTWDVVHETLKLGQALQISELPNPISTAKHIDRWRRKNMEKFPILKRMKLSYRQKEGKVICYFVPFGEA